MTMHELSERAKVRSKTSEGNLQFDDIQEEKEMINSGFSGDGISGAPHG
jgi:hypothetical protein